MLSDDDEVGYDEVDGKQRASDDDEVGYDEVDGKQRACVAARPLKFPGGKKLFDANKGVAHHGVITASRQHVYEQNANKKGLFAKDGRFTYRSIDPDEADEWEDLASLEISNTQVHEKLGKMVGYNSYNAIYNNCQDKIMKGLGSAMPKGVPRFRWWDENSVYDEGEEHDVLPSDEEDVEQNQDKDRLSPRP